MPDKRQFIRVPVSKTEGGPFFGYADIRQLEAGGLFKYEGDIPTEEVDTSESTATGPDDNKPPPPPARGRKARQHPAS